MLIPGICTQCGATLSVDNEKDAMVCPHCNTPFVVEKAIQNFSNVYNINAQNVYVQGNIENEYKVEGGVLKKYTGNFLHIKIPEGVKKIGGAVFTDSMIESVELCDDVVEIDARAFAGCRHLKEIRFSANLEEVVNSFYYCDNLESIYVSSNSLGKAQFIFGRIDLDTDRFICDSPKLMNIYVDGEKLGLNDNRLRFFEMTPIGYPHYLKRIEEEKEKTHQSVVEAWRLNNKCSYCGGEFVGLLHKRCCRCKKDKDY